ncbi:MFS transporter [Oceanispirochaeta sp. M1]|uniref:MFS transporter n=2 Tax=Oceanispirochaeta TaxID=2035349 RepID=UPI000E099460|nr:MFS transporter [Oceanispirochaeta sp. M1]RDG29148.1 MFS transporter [Oceanispirochaeta sp. M1]
MIKTQQVFKNPHIKSFLFSMFIFGVSVGLYGGVLNNFLADILNIDRFGRGVVEFLRELPGLLLFLMLALLYRIPENRIVRISFFIALLGMAGLAFATEARWMAVTLIVLWSTGEHLMMPVRQSISIHSAIPGKEGVAMGLTRSAGNIGSVIGFYMVSLIFMGFGHFEELMTYRVVFGLGALFTLAGLLFTLRLGQSEGHVKRPRMMLLPKYRKYYILEMFFGARKQVFMTFAPYVLILNYGASTQLIATLYGIFSLANIFMNPVMGKLVDTIGHKAVLILDSFLLILLCFLYGFAHHLFPGEWAFRVICVVFVLDAMLFSAGIARAVYVRTLSDNQEELTGTLSTGISVNHLISVVIALLGGLLWERLGMEILFSAAALFGIASLFYTMTLPGRKKILEPV